MGVVTDSVWIAVGGVLAALMLIGLAGEVWNGWCAWRDTPHKRNTPHGGLLNRAFRRRFNRADKRNRLLVQKGIPLEMIERPWLLRADPEMRARYERALTELAATDMELSVLRDEDYPEGGAS